MICKECGRELMENDKFCVICGTPNPLFENAEPAQRHTEYTQADTTPAQEQTVFPQTDTIPEQEQPAFPQTDTTPAQEQPAFTQPNPEFPYYTRPSAEPAQEYQPPYGNRTAAREERVKYTCSLSVVIFCGIVIFLLSVACGVLAGLYVSAKNSAVPMPYSITEYESGAEN